MDGRDRKTFLKPISKRLNNLGSKAIRRSAEAILRSDMNGGIMNGDALDSIYDDDNLAPVMPAIDAVQQLMEEEIRKKKASDRLQKRKVVESNSKININNEIEEDNVYNQANQLDHQMRPGTSKESEKLLNNTVSKEKKLVKKVESTNKDDSISSSNKKHSPVEICDEDESLLVRNNPLSNFTDPNYYQKKQEDYEFIPKSVILDVYSNDPEVKRFLKQLPKICNEYGYNEQDYKCYSCRRPIGMVFGQPRLCHFDGHQYCSECHLGEKSTIPSRILCNWDFNKYPISKRNQHFLTLISNEPMFELKIMSPLLYKTCPELREIEELRHQAFSIRSYCFTCVQDSISFELTKLVWPREHLMKQIDQYSLEDLIQIKSGALKNVLKNVIAFGRQHVLSCMLCCQKGFICELCKSSQIIYPFDTESIHRCNSCQSIYHKICFESRSNCDECPRCLRLKAREREVSIKG